jgi:hypothetical protein
LRRDKLLCRPWSVTADHPDTLIVRFNIAREVAARGDHAGAEKEFRKLLGIMPAR